MRNAVGHWVAALTIVCFPAASANAADQSRHNVLLIVTDDMNTDLGCYGHPLVKSPGVDRLARRGVVFRHAYCQFPVCNPSRSSFMTGLYADQTGVLGNGGDFRQKQPDVVTMSQMFRRNGYYVARVGKIFHYGVPDDIGTDGSDDAASWDYVVNPRGIDREVHDRIHTIQKGQFGGTLSWLRIDSDEQHTDEIGTSAAIRLLEEHNPSETGKPYFLAVGLYRPHTPYVAPGRFFDLYSRDAIQPVLERPDDRDDIPLAALADRPFQRELTVQQRQEIIQAYYASISFADAQVVRLLDAVDRLKLRQNTIVVFLSDHGYHLGRHGLWQKGDLFEGSCQVPLIIATPDGLSAGQSTNAITELVDVYPTLAELCGLQAPDHLRGQSLVPILNDVSQAGKPAALTRAWSGAGFVHREMRGKKIAGYSIRTARYRYTEWGDGEFGTELYDYEIDPEEFDNLASAASHRETVTHLHSLLEEIRQRAE